MGRMCYSAQIRADYKRFFREFGAVLSLRAFAKLYYERQGNPKIKIPKAVDAAQVENASTPSSCATSAAGEP